MIAAMNEALPDGSESTPGDQADGAWRHATNLRRSDG